MKTKTKPRKCLSKAACMILLSDWSIRSEQDMEAHEASTPDLKMSYVYRAQSQTYGECVRNLTKAMQKEGIL